MTSSYSVKVLDDVKTRLGAKVKAVITTSDAWPHIGGLREYAARGIPVLALDLNVPILERLFAARYATFPDTLAKSPRAPVIRKISTRTVVGAGPTRMELIPYRTASGERQMMVYFPDTGCSTRATCSPFACPWSFCRSRWPRPSRRSSASISPSIVPSACTTTPCRGRRWWRARSRNEPRPTV